MVRHVVTIAVALTLAACLQDGQRAERMAKSGAQYDAETDACKAKFPKPRRKNNVAYARCMNEVAERHMIPDATDPDLWQQFATRRLAIAVDMDSGKISLEEGEARLDRAYSDVITEQERRYATRRSANAAEDAAASAAASAASAATAVRRPTNCTRLGYSVYCD